MSSVMILIMNAGVPSARLWIEILRADCGVLGFTYIGPDPGIYGDCLLRLLSDPSQCIASPVLVN